MLTYIGIAIVGCTPSTDSPPVAAGCSPQAANVGGTYDPASEACILDEAIDTACSELWSWWHESACPNFGRYVHGSRPRPSPYSGTTPWGAETQVFYTVTRCGGPEQAYDVVQLVDGRGGDEGTTTEAVFDSAGSMVWLRMAHYSTSPGFELCCQPSSNETYWKGWGTPVRYDCADGTPYTPADFPDSADTGATSPTTGDTGTGETADTSDTGATCR